MPKLKAFCVVCHGLNSHPESMGSLVNLLKEEGVETKEVILKGHEGDLSLMKSVSASLWLDELEAAYRESRKKADEQGVPLYYLGFSLGGLLNASLMQKNKEVFYEKILLFAPALSLRLSSELARVFKLLGDSFMIPNFSPKGYRYHDGASAGAYKALFDLLDGVRKEKFRDLNTKTLIFIDPLDELVSCGGLKRIKSKYHMSQWKIVSIKKDKSSAQYRFRHLILDEATLGSGAWEFLQEKIRDFL